MPDLDQSLQKIDVLIQRRAIVLTERVLENTYHILVARTPVDTGKASSNWNVADGEPDTTVTDATSPPPFQPPSVTIGPVYYTTNSVPYIVFLEHGSSKQAPAGMVTLTAAELEQVEGPIIRPAIEQIRGIA